MKKRKIKPKPDLAQLDITYACNRWQESDDFAQDRLIAAANTTLERTFPYICEISLVLTDDKFITELNNKYRGKLQPTNVLAFPVFENPIAILQPANDEVIHLGDIIMSYDTVMREAIEQQKPFINHILHLLVHGVLHLLGYLHDEVEDAKTMENLEIEILDRLGVPNPYLL